MRSAEWREEFRRRVTEGTRRGIAAKRRREQHGLAEEAELARVRPRDLERLERTGTVSPALVPLLAIAAKEARSITGSLGGALEECGKSGAQGDPTRPEVRRCGLSASAVTTSSPRGSRGLPPVPAQTIESTA